jgi:hypothetical protein
MSRYLIIPKMLLLLLKGFGLRSNQHDVTDYILKPLARIDFIKSILKLKNRS